MEVNQVTVLAELLERAEFEWQLANKDRLHEAQTDKERELLQEEYWLHLANLAVDFTAVIRL